MEATLADIYQAVVDGQEERVRQRVDRALREGFSAERVLDTGLIRAMGEVGLRFQRGDFYVPEMLVAALAMQAGLSRLKPALVSQGVGHVGKVVIGTVKGDLHDIGKRLVAMMLEGAGFEVVDLGVDTAPQAFVRAVEEHSPDLLGMSALLTTTMPNMQATIHALCEHNVRAKVKVIVGGAAVTPDFAAHIGADGFAPDASRAATLAVALLRGYGSAAEKGPAERAHPPDPDPIG
jgi:5-methyltetrahydrofolate--homocysteine methyltransferase